MSGLETTPLASVITKFKKVTSGTSMITRAPYTNGQYYRLRKIECATTDSGGLSGIAWKFWDQDLSSTTAGTVGSAAHALIFIGGPISGNPLFSGLVPTSVNRTDTARIPFFAGVTMHTTVESFVTLELEVV